MDKITLMNQVLIMKALRSLVGPTNLSNQLQDQIILTEAAIRNLA
jgi:hypothetical protein